MHAPLHTPQSTKRKVCKHGVCQWAWHSARCVLGAGLPYPSATLRAMTNRSAFNDATAVACPAVPSSRGRLQLASSTSYTRNTITLQNRSSPMLLVSMLKSDSSILRDLQGCPLGHGWCCLLPTSSCIFPNRSSTTLDRYYLVASSIPDKGSGRSISRELQQFRRTSRIMEQDEGHSLSL